MNNIINNSEYSFEFWGHPAATYLHEIYFENNTCMNAGFGWGHSQRPDPNGAHLMFWGYHDEQTENIFIRNNIFYNSSNYGSYYGDLQTTIKFNIDFNCWYESSGLIAVIANQKYDFSSRWNDFVTVSGKDAHSLNADPLLNPDFTLSENSPCINAGTITTVNDDFNGTMRPQSDKFDIGAYEYPNQSKVDFKRSNSMSSVFPNPAKNVLTIKLSENEKSGLFSIIDLSGQEQIKFRLKDNETTIDISSLKSGFYFTRICFGKSIEMKKFIVR